MNRIVFVVNNPLFFVSHRLAIGKELIKNGKDVHVVAPGACPDELLISGLTYHRLDMSRNGMNPLGELMIIYRLWALFRSLKPDLVHLITIKPYLYGGVAARLAGVPAVVSAVAGLGILFSRSGLKHTVLRAVLYVLYKLAFGHKNQIAIFQNTTDRDLLIDWGVLAPKKAVLIKGSGVELGDYPCCPEPEGIPVVAFASRLLADKGVFELAEASRILKKRGVEAKFWLIGEVDEGNSNAVKPEKLAVWAEEGLIELFGFRRDIATLFAQSNIVALPSYYGEGLPKVLLEAAACGRAVVTTDHPGCRDAIVAGETGLLVPVKNAAALADALEQLILDAELRNSMGLSGRALAEREFAVQNVVQSHMAIYASL